MTARAAITVNRPMEEVQRRWREPGFRPDRLEDAEVTFSDAPGDRGTEIHVDVAYAARGAKLGGLAQKLAISQARAKAMDALRQFKQRVETGVIARSDSTPTGETIESKFKQRPAHPLEESELAKAGLS